MTVDDHAIYSYGLKGRLHHSHIQFQCFIVHGGLVKHAMLTLTSIITCHHRQCDHCLTPITGLMSYEASSHMTNSQRVRCELGGLLTVEVYQSEEGPDSKV